MAGKGDRLRPCDPVKYREGWERAFGGFTVGQRLTFPAPDGGTGLTGHGRITRIRHDESGGSIDVEWSPQPARLPGDRYG